MYIIKTNVKVTHQGHCNAIQNDQGCSPNTLSFMCNQTFIHDSRFSQLALELTTMPVTEAEETTTEIGMFGVLVKIFSKKTRIT